MDFRWKLFGQCLDFITHEKETYMCPSCSKDARQSEDSFEYPSLRQDLLLLLMLFRSYFTAVLLKVSWPAGFCRLSCLHLPSHQSHCKTPGITGRCCQSWPLHEFWDFKPALRVWWQALLCTQLSPWFLEF